MRLSLLPLIAALAAAQDYFPLAEGNEWRYRASGGAELRVSVGARDTIADRTYHRLSGYAPGEILARRDEAGNLARWDPASKADVPVTRFGPAGQTFPAGASRCGEQGTVQAAPAPVSGFEALEVRYRPGNCADAGLEREFFTPNLGMVRRVTGAILGPVTYDLVWARLGAVTYQREPGVSAALRLRASAMDLPQKGDPFVIAGALAVSVRGDTPLTLDFTSSQRFDLVLVDPSGKRQWTWSADKTFAAATAREQWSGDREFEWTLAPPTKDPYLPGTYSIEAWITSSGQRTLAAAAPLLLR